MNFFVQNFFLKFSPENVKFSSSVTYKPNHENIKQAGWGNGGGGGGGGGIIGLGL